MTSNYPLADFVARFNTGSSNRLRYIVIKPESNIIIEIVKIFYNMGIIASFHINEKGAL
jgi:ribosomal protein S8